MDMNNLTRKQITLKVLANFINANVNKINDIEIKANNINLFTNEGNVEIKIKTSKDYTKDELDKHCLWASFSEDELLNNNKKTYFVVVCSDNLDKSIVFSREEAVEHFKNAEKKKKDGTTDYDMYPKFLGRVCVDNRVKSGFSGIDISRFVNNYIL